ncbi:hypothetical protein Taro_034371 [Colocasia esculenta]|uniref:Uncharacterized protein n=1 Tax=Colocasia esculenta TaxID=4460 RepID=A0A843VW94_COLES|nr:hypothetical protein [Colocasia esculenta]
MHDAENTLCLLKPIFCLIGISGPTETRWIQIAEILVQVAGSSVVIMSTDTYRARKPELCLLPSVDSPFLAVDSLIDKGMRAISCSGRSLQIAADLPVAVQVATGRSDATRGLAGLARSGVNRGGLYRRVLDTTLMAGATPLISRRIAPSR